MRYATAKTASRQNQGWQERMFGVSGLIPDVGIGSDDRADGARAAAKVNRRFIGQPLRRRGRNDRESTGTEVTRYCP